MNKKCNNEKIKKSNFIKQLIEKQRKEYYVKKAEEDIEQDFLIERNVNNKQ